MNKRSISLLSAVFSASFLCAIFLLCACNVSAQTKPTDQVVKQAIDAFRKNHPDLWEMVDEEKLTTYATFVHSTALEAQDKIASGKMTSEEAKSFRIGKPPLDILKPEALEELRSHSKSRTGPDPSKFDPKTGKFSPPTDPKIINAPKTILGHVRSGEVEEWPTAGEVEHAEPKRPREESSSVAANRIKEKDFSFDGPVALPDIPNCPKDTSMKYQFAEPDPKDKTVKDLLFIRGPIPSVPDELFGKEVRVFRYTGKSDDEASIAIAAMRVQCLPFRMRLSEHVSVQDFGLSALKNYDRDFNGKGELHPYVKTNQADLLR